MKLKDLPLINNLVAQREKLIDFILKEDKIKVMFDGEEFVLNNKEYPILKKLMDEYLITRLNEVDRELVKLGVSYEK